MGLDFWNNYGSSAKAKSNNAGDYANEEEGTLYGVGADQNLNSHLSAEAQAKAKSAYTGAFTDQSKTDAERAQFQGLLGQSQAWNAPQLGSASQMAAAKSGPASTYGGASLDQGAANQSRSFQNALAGQLWDQSQGKGPNLAANQLQSGIEASLRAQQAAAASQQGRSNYALSARQLGNTASDMQGQASMQAAQLRMQQQLAAQGQLAGVSESMRGQDLNAAGQNAGFAQQAGLFNAGQQNQFALQNAAWQQGANQFNAGSQNQFSLANQQSTLAGQQMKNQFAGQLLGLGQNADFNDYSRGIAARDTVERAKIRQQDADAANDNRQNAAVGGVASFMGKAMMGASDERVKTDVKPGDRRLESFYAALGAHSYKYKSSIKDDPKAGTGEYVSPMAQELEKTELGKSMVTEDDKGVKIVNYAKGFGAMLAGQAMMARKIEALESALGNRK